MPCRKAKLAAQNGDTGHVASSRRRIPATNMKQSTYRTAAMKVNDRKEECEMRIYIYICVDARRTYIVEVLELSERILASWKPVSH